MMPKLYVVGDSTVSKFKDTTYYYPRFGYGAVLDEYFKNIEIVNLALSGRSSRSFTVEDNYKELIDNISNGDYLLIGFGHNDEKYDDSFRFAAANLDTKDPKGFKYSLYNNYIKPALDKGATPILTTPVIRLSSDDNYEGELIHDTKYGNYQKAILDLANECNILAVDITKESLNIVKPLGYNKAIPLHAVSKAKMVNNKLTYDEKSVDKTHLSFYGAKYSAYFIAKAVFNSNLKLKDYLSKIVEPTIEELTPNPLYVFKPYISPDLDNYHPKDEFKADEYYGTAFGSIKTTDPIKDGYRAMGYKDNYIVGQSGEKCLGNINASTEGFAFLFKRVKRSDNFIFSAKAKIIECGNVRQAAFGLMLRGDVYINQVEANENIVTNYVSSGLITTDKVTFALLDRRSSSELDRICPIGEIFYKKGDEAILELERLGQVVKGKVIYKGITYNYDFIDFDYYNDENYLFVGMYGTYGTVVKFSDVKFELTGKAMEA